MSDSVPRQLRGRGSRGPRSLLGPDPRSRLYEAALRSFDRVGIARASMDEVARSVESPVAAAEPGTIPSRHTTAY